MFHGPVRRDGQRPLIWQWASREPSRGASRLVATGCRLLRPARLSRPGACGRCLRSVQSAAVGYSFQVSTRQSAKSAADVAFRGGRRSRRDQRAPMYAPSSESERLVKELPVKTAVPHPSKDSVGRGDIHCNATTRCGAEATALALMSIVEPTALETDRGQTIAVEPKQDVRM